MNGYDERDHAEEAFNLATMREEDREDFSGYKECGHPEYRNTGDGPQPNDCGCTDSDEQDIRDVMAGNWSAASDEMMNLAAGLLPGELEARIAAALADPDMTAEAELNTEPETFATMPAGTVAGEDAFLLGIESARREWQSAMLAAKTAGEALAAAWLAELAAWNRYQALQGDWRSFAAHAQAGVEAIAEASK